MEVGLPGNDDGPLLADPVNVTKKNIRKFNSKIYAELSVSQSGIPIGKELEREYASFHLRHVSIADFSATVCV